MSNKKQYTWQPDAQITFTGKEFETFYNGLRLFMVGPLSPQSFVMIGDLQSLLNRKFEKMIEEGIAIESTTEQ